jgi:hypothetical protein
MWALVLVMVGFLAVGANMLHASRMRELDKVKADLAELFKEVDHNSERIASFGKFVEIVEQAQTRNGNTA